jgi:hypothetical protein
MQETLLGVVPVAPTGDEPSTTLDIAPAFGVLDRASGSVPTIAGTAYLGWSQSPTAIHMALSLPANSQAMLHLPATSSDAVTMGNVTAKHVDGVSVAGAGDGEVTLRVGAGSYAFDILRG